MPSDYTVYVDTNCFVQLRDLGQVDWRELLPNAKQVEIAVAPIVVTELDRFKVDRDRRKRDRSRRALASIEAATANDDFTTVLADGPVRVTLRLCVGGRMPWDDYPDLDPGSPDDQLVLCALRETARGEKLLMSFDNNPLIRARVARLAARKSPVAWQLPAQEDEAGQEVAKLKRELAEARSTRPKIEAAFMRDGQPTSLFDVRVLTAPPIPDRLLDYLVETWLEANPKTPPVLEVRPSHTLFDPFAHRITQDDIQAYERDYDTFVRQTREHFTSVPGKLFWASRTPGLDYEIHNRSSVAASNLLVRLQAPAGVHLLGDAEDREGYVGRFEPPKAPEPPKPRSLRDYTGLGAPLASFTPPRPRDPTRFYWQDRPDEGEGSLICADFRARQDFVDTYFALPVDELPLAGQLVLTVSATNLAAPVRVEAGLRFRKEEVGWDDPDLLALLPDWMRPAFETL